MTWLGTFLAFILSYAVIAPVSFGKTAREVFDKWERGWNAAALRAAGENVSERNSTQKDGSR